MSKKKKIELTNRRSRATIKAASDISEIKQALAESRALIDLSTGKLHEYATREYAKTAEEARKREEELRVTESSIEGYVSPTGIGVGRRKTKLPRLV